MSIFHQSQYLEYCSFIILYWNPVIWVLQLCSSFSESFEYSIVPFFQYQFRISLLISTKKLTVILTGIVLSEYVRLERINILTILNLPIHEHSTSLNSFRSFLFQFLLWVFCSFSPTDFEHVFLDFYLSNFFVLICINFLISFRF